MQKIQQKIKPSQVPILGSDQLNVMKLNQSMDVNP